MRYAIFIMVGPGETEARRLRAVLVSLFRHEPATPILVVVNDTGGPLPDVSAIVPATCEFIEIKKIRPPSVHEHTWNIQNALRLIAARDDLEWSMKLDTDALVIAPFAEKITRYFREHPDVGQAGRTDVECDGTPVDFGVYRTFAIRLKKLLQVRRSPSWGFSQAFFGDYALVRKLMLQSAANGADDGRHVQGGAYAISQAATRKIDQNGWLADEPFSRVFGLGDDLITSVQVAAAGFKLGSMVGPGEPFGIEDIGLPFLPAELAAKGYSIIHSIKNDKSVSEADVLKFFDIDV